MRQLSTRDPQKLTTIGHRTAFNNEQSPLHLYSLHTVKATTMYHEKQIKQDIDHHIKFWCAKSRTTAKGLHWLQQHLAYKNRLPR